MGSDGDGPQESRLLIPFVAGRRNEALIRELMESAKKRLKSPSDLVLMSDAEKGYEILFAYIFGEPHRVARKGDRGASRRLASHQKEPRSPAGDHVRSRRRIGRGEKQSSARLLKAGGEGVGEARLPKV